MGVCDPVVDRAGAAGGERPRSCPPADRHPCARPGAAVGLVSGAELACAVRAHRLLGPVRPARQTGAARCRVRQLVGDPPGGSMRRRNATPPSTRARRGPSKLMGAYLLRRLLLVIPTLFGIIAINFVVVQFAPGGPVEQMISELRGRGGEATGRVSGRAAPRSPPPPARARIAAPAVSTRIWSPISAACSASTSRPGNVSSPCCGTT